VSALMQNRPDPTATYPGDTAPTPKLLQKLVATAQTTDISVHESKSASKDDAPKRASVEGGEFKPVILRPNSVVGRPISARGITDMVLWLTHSNEGRKPGWVFVQNANSCPGVAMLYAEGLGLPALLRLAPERLGKRLCNCYNFPGGLDMGVAGVGVGTPKGGIKVRGTDRRQGGEAGLGVGVYMTLTDAPKSRRTKERAHGGEKLAMLSDMLE
ncbi:hypothetical protein KIPB_010886, partial [Kipferlia bialata]